MPNWCYSNITFYGDEREVEDTYQKIKKSTTEEYTKSMKESSVSFGNDWLGNIADIYGYNYNDIPCRGMLEGDLEYNKENNNFNFEISSAWSFNNEMWDRIIHDNYNNLNYVFIAEEPNMGYYENSDLNKLFYKEEYFLSMFVSDELYDKYVKIDREDFLTYEDGDYICREERFESTEELLNFFNNCINSDTKFENFGDILNYSNEVYSEDVYICVYDYFAPYRLVYDFNYLKDEIILL